MRRTTKKRQTKRERIDAKVYEYGGKSQSARAWADELGITPKTIKRRLREGRPKDEVFSTDRRVNSERYGKYLKKYYNKLEREAELKEYGEDTDVS